MSTLGIVVITYGNEDVLKQLLGRLVAEKKKNDYLVIVDNHSNQRCAQMAARSKTVDLVIKRPQNPGFAAAANQAAAAMPKQVDTLLFLNPDVLPATGALGKLRTAGDHFDAWMGLLTLPDGTINSAGNVYHTTGLSWCDHFGQAAKSVKNQHRVKIVSGACFAIKRQYWQKLGGFYEPYYMYFEDTDLSLLARRAGLTCGLVPTAYFEHDYVYNKSNTKWFYLERNRYVFILRQWPLAAIVIMLPLLLASELAFWVMSIAQGRFWLRVKSCWSFLKIAPTTLRARRQITTTYPISNTEFFEFLHPHIDTPLRRLGAVARLVNWAFNLDDSVARRLLAKI